MGKQEQHEVTGIVRNLPASVVKDFSCAELVNMRNKDGVWRPVGDKKVEVENAPNEIRDSSKFFLHTTGTTQQMIGYKYGVVAYFDYPNGTVANSILTLPAADSSRKVRFNAVGNILVIFVEAEVEGAPYMKYAVWKKGENETTEKYYLLPDLPAPNLEFSLKKALIKKQKAPNSIEYDYYNYGLLGKGLVVVVYETIDGDCFQCGPPMLFNYGDEEDGIKETGEGGVIFYYGRRPIFRIKSFEDIIPVAWRNIIGNISIYATAPSKDVNINNISDYIDNEITFRKVHEVGAIFFDYSAAERKGSATIFLEDGSSGQINVEGVYTVIPMSHVLINEDLPHLIEFGSQPYTGSDFNGWDDKCIIKKIGNQPVRVSINLDFGFKKVVNTDEYVDWDNNTGDGPVYLILLGRGDANGEIFNFGGANEINSVHKDIVLTRAGEYCLVIYNPVDKYFRDISNVAHRSIGTINYEGIRNDDSEENISKWVEVNIPEEDVLKTKKALLIENTPHAVYGSCDLNYNSRLFLGETTRILFKGYSSKDYTGGNRGWKEYYTCCFYTLIHTDDGEKTVASNWFDMDNLKLNESNTTNRLFFKFPTLLSYPDPRAYKMIIFFKRETDNTIYKFREYDLRADKNNHYAYCYIYAFDKILDETKLLPTTFNPKTDNQNSDSVLLLEATIRISIGILNDMEKISDFPKQINTINTTHNVIISELYNPLYFKNSHSYIVGDKPIIGLSANNLSIDASNFGVYPVFVFSGNGIYAMELGADVLVQRIVPLSGDVCINRDSITNIGGATLFASKDGLRILQGQRSEKITTPLELYGGNPLKDATLNNGNGILDAILNKHGLVGMVDSVDFQTFLAGAKCYFHYKESEVVITNEAYPYSYVYSLNTKMFHKIFERYYHVFNDYPNAYGTDADGRAIYNLGEEVVLLSGRRDVFVQTNPFKLTTDGFEMIRRIFTRFGWSAAPRDINFGKSHKISIYLFVSNDTRKWAWVDACEITSVKAPNGAQNFSPLRCPASVKYGMLVIAGDMDVVNDYLTHISVEYEQRYGNKLR